MSTVLYKPLGLAFSVAGGILAGSLFKKLWAAIAHDDPPEATDPDYSWGEVLVAAAVQGAVFGLVKAAVDRAGARGYERVTGTWPGK